MTFDLGLIAENSWLRAKEIGERKETSMVYIKEWLGFPRPTGTAWVKKGGIWLASLTKKGEKQTS